MTQPNVITQPVPEKGPIEGKVWASLIGAGSGTVLSTFLLWVLGAAFWTKDWTNEGADNAILAVPSPLSAFLLALVTAGLTFLGGYLAKHTPRSDRDALETITPDFVEGALALPDGMNGGPVTHSIHQVDRNRTDSEPERAAEE